MREDIASVHMFEEFYLLAAWFEVDIYFSSLPTPTCLGQKAMLLLLYILL
jgi:hypothetical protein